MQRIVALGGGEIGLLETLPIDREIVRLAKKKKPMALFVPTASGDSGTYWETFKEIYGKRLGCKTDVLFLIAEKPSRAEIRRKVLGADIVYAGGGDTLKMLKSWRKTGVDLLLKAAFKKGTVLSGISAGAMCWFRWGVSDSRKFWTNPDSEPMRIRGLDFVPATFSPHHCREKKWREMAVAKIMRRTSEVCLAVDDCAAVEIVGNGLRVISVRKGRGVRRVWAENGKLKMLLLPTGKQTPLAQIL